jgi:transposase
VRRGFPEKWDGTGGQDDQALGRSRGGFGAKIHGRFNGLGRPRESTLTPGQASDIGQAEALLAGHAPEGVIADKGCDSDALVEVIEGRGADAVTPRKRTGSSRWAYDRHTYEERNVCERFWAQAKQFRRVATRYEKEGSNVLAFAWVVAVTVMLK